MPDTTPISLTSPEALLAINGLYLQRSEVLGRIHDNRRSAFERGLDSDSLETLDSTIAKLIEAAS